MASVVLGNKEVGSKVTLKLGGIVKNFIVVNQGNPDPSKYVNADGTWLLIEKGYEKRLWHSSNVNDYENSDTHKYLNGDFLNLFEANIRNAIKQVKIPYRSGGSPSRTISSGANGLSAKLFLLSCYEIGWKRTDILDFLEDGACLSYFSGTAETDAKRICHLDETASFWWLRSPDASRSAIVWGISANGGRSTNGCSNSPQAIRFALVLPSTLLVSDDGSIQTNTAPAAPAGINVPSSIMGGSTISISWEASTDAEGNLAGYIVEKSTDGGTEWTEIYKSQNPGTTAQDNVAFGTESVMYRVKAFDTEGLASGWCTSGQVPVVNNVAPGAPLSITVPNEVKGGATLIISWAKATDRDGNLSGYELERKVNGQDWEQIYSGDKLTFTDSITKGWETVAYRVRAYDSLNAAGAYTTSATRAVNNNTAPVITCNDSSGSDLGVKAEGFTVGYSVSDEDGDTVTVTEAIDGVVQRSFQAELDQSHTFEVVGGTFMRVLNGKHTLTITADDGKETTVHRLTFTKEVTEATITLETPMDADGEITLAVLSVNGSIPADAEYTVEATNNGNDDEPVWQDATAAVKAGTNIIFENHTAVNGFAFNFRITVRRGRSGQGGYITSVQGGFQ